MSQGSVFCNLPQSLKGMDEISFELLIFTFLFLINSLNFKILANIVKIKMNQIMASFIVIASYGK